MRKLTTPQSQDPKSHAPRILSAEELQQALGGVMKSRHETAKHATSGD